MPYNALWENAFLISRHDKPHAIDRGWGRVGISFCGMNHTNPSCVLGYFCLVFIEPVCCANLYWFFRRWLTIATGDINVSGMKRPPYLPKCPPLSGDKFIALTFPFFQPF